MPKATQARSRTNRQREQTDIVTAAVAGVDTAPNSPAPRLEDERTAPDSKPVTDRGLLRIIQPTVQDRWKGLIQRKYKASTVREVLDGTNFQHLYFLFQMFELMEETWPRLGGNLHRIRQDVSKLNFQILPYAKKGEKPTGMAVERAKFVEEVWWGMKDDPIWNRNGRESTVYDMMDAFGKGLSVLELDWQRRADGALVPIGTRWLRSNFFDYPYKYDQSERLMLAPTGEPHTELIDFPDHKFIVTMNKWKSANLGTQVGMMRSLAPWWIYSNFATEWLMQFAQIFGIPIRWANYTAPGDKRTVSEMLENMGAAGWGAFPQGTDLNIEQGGSVTGMPQAYLLERCDTLADIHILGQTLTSEVKDKGSRAAGEVHERVYEQRVKHAGEAIGGRLTDTLARWVVIENYGDDEEVPFVSPIFDDALTPNQKAEISKTLFIDMGMPVAKDWLYEFNSVPVPDDEADLFEKPAPEPIQPVGAVLPQRGTKPAVGPKPAREQAFAAKLPPGVPDDVIQALAALPEGVRDHYVEALNARHYKGGQKGGGRFMPKRTQDAIAATREIMQRWPAEGQHRGRRHIMAFGLPDNEAEFRAYNAPGMADKIDSMARRAKKTVSVDFRELRTTQSTIDGEKVEAMLQTTAENAGTPKELLQRSPVVIKRSNRKWIWDGHHRAVRDKLLGAQTFEARFIDLDNDGEEAK